MRRWGVGSVVATLFILVGHLEASGAATEIEREVGTVSTLAGPAFCPLDTAQEMNSAGVGALAVGRAGELWFESGRSGDGQVTEVRADGAVRIIRIGGAGVPLRRGRVSLATPRGPAADAEGSLLVATAHSVLGAAAAEPKALAGEGAGSAEAVMPEESGDDDSAANARFVSIQSITTDEAGNIFVVDRFDARADTVRIRLINRGREPLTIYPGTLSEMKIAPGTIDTIAGVAGSANSGDGGPARQAVLAGRPPAVAVRDGRLYVALHRPPADSERAGSRIRIVNLTGEAITAHGLAIQPGNIGTVAGGQVTGFRGDGGIARKAGFSFISGIDTDDKGNLFVADRDHHRVRRIGHDGKVTTVVGFGGVGARNGGFDGNGRKATKTRLDRPADVKTGPRGELYVSDGGNRQLRFVDNAGIVRAAPGNGVASSVGCTNPRPETPVSVTIDSRGDTYFVSPASGRVMSVSPAGVVLAVPAISASDQLCVSPSGCARSAADAGSRVTTGIRRPGHVARGQNGGIYVMDGGDNRLLFYNPTGSEVQVHGVRVPAGRVEPVAGNGVIGGDGDGASALKAQLSGHSVLAADARGNAFVADPVLPRVRQIDASGIITTLVPPPDVSITECCRRPAALATDGAGNLYVLDSASNRVWLLNRSAKPLRRHGVTLKPGALVAIVGSGSIGFGGDGGSALEAALERPSALAVDTGNNLFIADAAEHTVRKVDVAGTITTAAGTGQAGFSGDGLPGRLTKLASPTGVAVNRCGNLVIADSANSRVRQLNVVRACAAAAAERSGDGQQGGNGSLLPIVGAVLGAVAGLVFLVRRRR